MSIEYFYSWLESNRHSIVLCELSLPSGPHHRLIFHFAGFNHVWVPISQQHKKICQPNFLQIVENCNYSKGECW